MWLKDRHAVGRVDHFVDGEASKCCISYVVATVWANELQLQGYAFCSSLKSSSNERSYHLVRNLTASVPKLQLAQEQLQRIRFYSRFPFGRNIFTPFFKWYTSLTWLRHVCCKVRTDLT